MLPCRRFADVLADACARLGADVGRYSFIAVDLHHLLLAGLPAHPWKNAFAEDGGPTSAVRLRQVCELIQALRRGSFAAAVRHQ